MTGPIIADDIVYSDQRSALIVGDDVAAVGAAAVAARHADLRLIAGGGLADAAALLARSSGPDVVLVETTGAAPDIADAALTAIDTIARERDIDVVVAMTDDQVDLVAARLFGRHAQLLCRPDIAARVAALGWAGALRSERLHDSARDADERLRLLNAEVARFAETLARLAADRGQVRDVGLGFRAEPAAQTPAPVDPATVRDVIRSRRLRAAYFPENLLADPAWDMLLDLFAADLEHRRVSVSSLCIAAAVPGTTALRWIGALVEAQVFARDSDPADRRRAFISLSPTARDGMQRYFAAVRRAGLAPA